MRKKAQEMMSSSKKAHHSCSKSSDEKMKASPSFYPNPSFFKIMIGDFAQAMFIPPKFAQNLHGLLKKDFHLEDSIGKRWIVNLTVIDGSLAFQHGWNNFVTDHSITFGEILTFKHISMFLFSVQVFATSGSERLHFKEKCKRKRSKNGKSPDILNLGKAQKNYQASEGKRGTCAQDISKKSRAEETPRIVLSDNEDKDDSSPCVHKVSMTHEDAVQNEKNPKAVNKSAAMNAQNVSQHEKIDAVQHGKDNNAVNKESVHKTETLQSERNSQDTERLQANEEPAHKQNNAKRPKIVSTEEFLGHSYESPETTTPICVGDENGKRTVSKVFARKSHNHWTEKYSKEKGNCNKQCKNEISPDILCLSKAQKNYEASEEKRRCCAEDSSKKNRTEDNFPIVLSDDEDKDAVHDNEVVKLTHVSSIDHTTVQNEKNSKDTNKSTVNERNYNVQFSTERKSVCKMETFEISTMNSLRSSQDAKRSEVNEEEPSRDQNNSERPSTVSKKENLSINESTRSDKFDGNNKSEPKMFINKLDDGEFVGHRYDLHESATPKHVEDEGRKLTVSKMFARRSLHFSTDEVSKEKLKAASINLSEAKEACNIMESSEVPLNGPVLNKKINCSLPEQNMGIISGEFSEGSDRKVVPFSDGEVLLAVKQEIMDLTEVMPSNYADFSTTVSLVSQAWLLLPGKLPGLLKKGCSRKVVVLQDPSMRLWPVLYLESINFIGFVAGWESLVSANNLQQGHTVHIESTNASEPIFKVNFAKV